MTNEADEFIPRIYHSYRDSRVHPTNGINDEQTTYSFRKFDLSDG